MITTRLPMSYNQEWPLVRINVVKGLHETCKYINYTSNMSTFISSVWFKMQLFFVCKCVLNNYFHDNLCFLLRSMFKVIMDVLYRRYYCESCFLERSGKMSRAIRQPILLWAAVMKQFMKHIGILLIYYNMLIHKI